MRCSTPSVVVRTKTRWKKMAKKWAIIDGVLQGKKASQGSRGQPTQIKGDGRGNALKRLPPPSNRTSVLPGNAQGSDFETPSFPSRCHRGAEKAKKTLNDLLKTRCSSRTSPKGQNLMAFRPIRSDNATLRDVRSWNHGRLRKNPNKGKAGGN